MDNTAVTFQGGIGTISHFTVARWENSDDSRVPQVAEFVARDARRIANAYNTIEVRAVIQVNEYSVEVIAVLDDAAPTTADLDRFMKEVRNAQIVPGQRTTPLS